MKKYVLMILSAFLLPVQGQPPAATAAQNQAEEVARAVDVLIAAYNGAQQEIARQQGGAAAVVDAGQRQRIHQETAAAIHTLQGFAEGLRQGRFAQAAEGIDALQTQLNRLSGQRGRELAQVADYLRRGGTVYDDWQRRQQVKDVREASPEQIGDLVGQVQAELAAGSQAEREIAGIIGGVWGLLKAFDQIANAPQPYAAERQAMSREIADLQALAQAQGMRGTQAYRSEGLLQLLKLRVAEHQIGMIDARADAQLRHSLEALLRRPQPLFTPQESLAVQRLLAQLGHEFADSLRLWQAQEEALLRR